MMSSIEAWAIFSHRFDRELNSIIFITTWKIPSICFFLMNAHFIYWRNQKWCAFSVSSNITVELLFILCIPALIDWIDLFLAKLHFLGSFRSAIRLALPHCNFQRRIKSDRKIKESAILVCFIFFMILLNVVVRIICIRDFFLTFVWLFFDSFWKKAMYIVYKVWTN